VARELAEKAGVPIVPGTKGLVETADDAVKESERIGFPVMLKATGGGGGMGLVVCHTSQEVKDGFETVRSRGETLFKSQFRFAIRYLGMLLMVHRSRAVSRIHELHVYEP